MTPLYSSAPWRHVQDSLDIRNNNINSVQDKLMVILIFNTILRFSFEATNEYKRVVQIFHLQSLFLIP